MSDEEELGTFWRSFGFTEGTRLPIIGFRPAAGDCPVLRHSTCCG